MKTAQVHSTQQLGAVLRIRPVMDRKRVDAYPMRSEDPSLKRELERQALAHRRELTVSRSEQQGKAYRAGKNLTCWEMQGWWSKGSIGQREEGGAQGGQGP